MMEIEEDFEQYNREEEARLKILFDLHNQERVRKPQ